MTQNAQDAYKELVRRTKETVLLGSCSSILWWDEQTYMPRQGAGLRAEQKALLSGMIHERAAAPEIGELLLCIEESDLATDPLSPVAANVRELRRRYDLRVKLPRSLVEELARATTLARKAWEEARAGSDYEVFRPHLDKVLGLKRREAAALGTGETDYDALLDRYEPGETAENLGRVFGAVRRELTDLVTGIVDSGRSPDPLFLERSYPLAQQAALGHSAAAAVGFDFEGGRLDETAHPFCSGIGPGDTRITTRYDPRRFQQAFFATLHEAGHGIYAQGLDPVHYGTPMGEPVSSGIHESQSRTWENLVGRSRAFWRHFYPKAQAAFPEALGGVRLDDFYLAINRVQPSFIRVEADEVTYNLHIVLRFEIEQALLSGDLPTTDVPGAWNEMYARYLGLTPPDDARGCLQDIHWGIGYFGYFPSYALGNLYAAQLFEQARTDLGDLDAQFAAGDFDSLRVWLSDRIYRQGNRYRPRELVETITGHPPSHRPLVDYLRAKYEPLYGI